MASPSTISTEENKENEGRQAQNSLLPSLSSVSGDPRANTIAKKKTKYARIWRRFASASPFALGLDQ
jgi:hypothetical protein